MQNARCKMQKVPRRALCSSFVAFCISHFAFCILVASEASATVLLPADFTTIVTESRTIAHGRVIEVRSALTGPRRTIESVVTVAVLEAIKGVAGQTVSFLIPNGQVGRYRRVLVGAPEFAEGDEVVVFLQGRAPALPTLFGLSQGVYRVTRDASARSVVAPPPAAAANQRIVRGDPARRLMPIEVFTREIRGILARAQ